MKVNLQMCTPPRPRMQAARAMQSGMSVAEEHTSEFPRGVGHRVENGWGLTKVAVVLLNGLIW